MRIPTSTVLLTVLVFALGSSADATNNISLLRRHRRRLATVLGGHQQPSDTMRHQYENVKRSLPRAQSSMSSISPQNMEQDDHSAAASSIPRGGGGGHGTMTSFTIALVGLVFAQVVAGLQLLQLLNDPFKWGLPTIDAARGVPPPPSSPNEFFCSSWNNRAFLWNMGLYLLWVLQHSGMSREPVKRMLGLHGRALERGVFGCATAIVWANLVLQWRPIQTCTTWAPRDTPLSLSCVGGGMVAWGLINMVSSMVWIPDHIFGIKGHYNDPSRDPVIIYTYPYGMIRHPGSGGFLFFLWGFALMARTVNYVVYAGMWTLFILLGTYFEEKALRREFGPAYDEYANQVPAYCPKLSFFAGARPSPSNEEA